MNVKERKLGRIFQIEFHEDENLFEKFNAFVKEKNIRNASITIFGALKETDMRSGFMAIIGDSAKLRFNDPREFVGVGNISWPERPPAVMGDVTWKEPEPYVHIHLAISGGPYRAQEVNVGHLSGGKVKGLFAEVIEFV
jgi:predicted DNA-binding protein with PD1-like motif